MSNRSELTRRTLLKVIGGAGASLVLGSFSAISCAEGTGGPLLPGSKTSEGKPAGKVFEPSAYVKIDPDGSITLTVTRPDMGQGVRTSLAMLIADEMDADWTKIKVVQAMNDGKPFGTQGVGGSNTIRSMTGELRKIGASARAMLIGAAARQWGVSAADCKTKNGKVISPDGTKTIAYGDLTSLAQSEPVPGQALKLKDLSELHIVGKGATRVDNPDVATGRAVFGLDAKIPGMVYAVIARPPTFGASLLSVDDAEAKKVAGVQEVFKYRNGVAVIGSNTWSAIAGRDALKLSWGPGTNPDLNSAAISEKLRAQLIAHADMPRGAKIVEATLDYPYLAHATMEPMNALADVREDSCVIWAPVQQPDGARRSAARAAGLQPDKVEVHVTLLGGGFGRRLFNDFVEEAVGLSKKLQKPVKLVWSREDDMKNDFYRGASHHSFKGAIDAQGKPVAWSHQAIQANQRPNGFEEAGLNYNIPNSVLRYTGVQIGVPTGPWRSVENTILNVSNEIFIDQLAHAAGKDPFEYRRALIKDQRLRTVLEAAAKYSGWGTPLPKGSGRGIACFSGYGSCAAHVVELSVAGNKIKLHRVVAVVDCGMAINPKGVEAQIQGAITDGLSTALRAEITIDKGGVVQNSWPDYRWMTMEAMPVVEVHIIAEGTNPGGMGEVGYPSVPPAVANAVFAATGKRVRKFPIRVEELV